MLAVALLIVAQSLAVEPPLLILRSACYNQTLFNQHVLENFMSSGALTPYTVLDYNDTCGTGWEYRIASAAVNVAVRGGTVLVTGWGGTLLCQGLGVLNLPPHSCSIPHAIGAITKEVAMRLHWSHVVITRNDVCAYVLNEVEEALLDAGLQVRRFRADDDSQVSITCEQIEESDTPKLIIRRHYAPTLKVNNTEENTSHYTSIVGLDPVEYINSLVLIERPVDFITSLKKSLQNTSVSVFDLFESVKLNGTTRWRLVTSSATESIHTDSWQTDVRWGSEFAAWGATAALSESASQFHGVCASIALGTVLLLAISFVTLRRALQWRRGVRRRPRTAVVLSPADFDFPIEEKRVGEGMESVLSWLQQLHDLPEQPDLLKRPLASSAPSSVCSVTKLSPDGRIRYNGDPVHVKYLPVASLELRRKTTDLLLVMQSLRHENINPFIGCVRVARPSLVYAAGARGCLQAVLQADELRLDWTFRLSLLTDLARGMRYLHASPLRVHGSLSSRCCLVDSRWVLRVSDYGASQFCLAQSLKLPRVARDMLWTSPEALRGGVASQPGDVFSFAIVMQEVIVRGEPYCMHAFTPEEIIEKLCRPPPLIRPSVSMGAAPPEAVGLMRQCWSEQPDLRPDFERVHQLLRQLHSGRKVNIMDSMFAMLEKYSNNLEELIKERTEQLDIEKRKTEQLLNRMLPRSVAERLLLGLRVEPELFEEVSIYFSDIVGFTAIAARSTPVQVVDLLNDLYTTFDAAIEQYAVYKVETIGDAYMVVGGLPIRGTEHAQAVATMALHLLHLAGEFRIRHSPAAPLHLRIGIHSGPCCAGVVGSTMPRYCLFGDTVNTAARMESTGAAWRIQVSADTAERLLKAGGFRLRSRGLTQVKGKGAMHTYWLLGKDGFDKALPSPPPLASEEVLLEADGENDSESSEAPPRRPNAPARVGRPNAPARVGRRGAGAGTAEAGQASAAAAQGSPCLRFSEVARVRTRFRYLRSSQSTCSVGSLDAPPRALRRQWSLERGEALSDEGLEPLALRAPPRPALPKYKTRADTGP